MAEIISLPHSRGITAATAALGELLLSMPSLGEAWKVSDPLPANYRPLIEQAIPLAERALAPADDKAMAVALGKLLEWIEVFAVVPLPSDGRQREARMTRIATWYREGLCVVPGDLLLLAVDRTIASHEYSILPMIAKVRKHISADWAARRTKLAHLQLAAKIGHFDPPPVRPEDRPVASAVLAAAQALKAPPAYIPSATLPALPAEPDVAATAPPPRRNVALSGDALATARASLGQQVRPVRRGNWPGDSQPTQDGA